MANTKNMDREARKLTKRDSRRALKKQYADLSIAERKTYRKFEGTFTEFLREQEAAKSEG
jgi:hypothetical protein